MVANKNDLRKEPNQNDAVSTLCVFFETQKKKRGGEDPIEPTRKKQRAKQVL